MFILSFKQTIPQQLLTSTFVNPQIDITPNGPACRAGLRIGDKILQCNGYDFTIVTHKKAVEYIQRYDILNLLVARRDLRV